MSALSLLTIAVLAAALATVMTLLAWRAARDERLHADACIAALAAEIYMAESDSQPAGGRGWAAEPFRGAPAAWGARFGAIAAIGLFAFASFGAVVLWLTPGAATAPAGPAAVEPAARIMSPLELVALGHDRDRDRLTVRGIVRNPPTAAAPVDRTDVVVHVYSTSGGAIASARAPLAAAIDPGHDSTFRVVIAGTGQVARYRVSFQRDERVVPHIDKRDTDVVARAQ
jgi:hypothetical protein